MKYLFISSGEYDGSYTVGMVFGSDKNIELIREEFIKMDEILMDLETIWEKYHIGIPEYDEKIDIKNHANWRNKGEEFLKMLPKIAYKYDCTYVKVKDEFNFKGEL
jgi:hypothetical protein